MAPRVIALLVGSILAAGLTVPAASADEAEVPTPPSSAEQSSAPADAVEPSASTSRRPGPRITNLGPTLCVDRVPTGLVRLPGPAGSHVIASVKRMGRTQLLTIRGGSGTIGGIDLRAPAFRGQLVYRDGRFSGSLTIHLATHRRIAPGWDQTVEVTAIPTGCGWRSVVQLKALTPGGFIDLRGPLDRPLAALRPHPDTHNPSAGGS